MHVGYNMQDARTDWQILLRRWYVWKSYSYLLKFNWIFAWRLNWTTLEVWKCNRIKTRVYLELIFPSYHDMNHQNIKCYCYCNLLFLLINYQLIHLNCIQTATCMTIDQLIWILCLNAGNMLTKSFQSKSLVFKSSLWRTMNKLGYNYKFKVSNV